MPGPFAFLIEVLFDVRGDVLLDVILVHRHAHSSFCLLLQFLRYFRYQYFNLKEVGKDNTADA